MPVLNVKEAADVKALASALNERAAKEAIYGMIVILKSRPSVLLADFLEILDDAAKWVGWSDSPKP